MAEEAGQIEIVRASRTKNFVSMQQDGVLKAISGITSLAEVEEVMGAVQELNFHT